MAFVARNLTSRTVHIKMHPAARSFPERREVLRVLERFGEVEMFRSLKYDPTNPIPNTFLSILSTEEAAQAAIEASPIRYRLITEPAPAPLPSTETSALNPPLSAASSPATTPASHNQQQQQPVPLPKQPDPIFELRISPSTHPHHETIASSPLHGHYTPISPLRSPIASDLASRVPNSIAKAGLIDWVTDSPRISTSAAAGTGRSKARHGDEESWAERGGEVESKIQWGRVGEEASKPWRFRERERAEREKDVPTVMRGLRNLVVGKG